MTSMTSCIVGKEIFYSHTFMHYKCDMKIGASRFIRVISLCHLVVCYHSWPWPGVLVSTCSLNGLVYVSDRLHRTDLLAEPVIQAPG